MDLKNYKYLDLFKPLTFILILSASRFHIGSSGPLDVDTVPFYDHLTSSSVGGVTLSHLQRPQSYSTTPPSSNPNHGLIDSSESVETVPFFLEENQHPQENRNDARRFVNRLSYVRSLLRIGADSLYESSSFHEDICFANPLVPPPNHVSWAFEGRMCRVLVFLDLYCSESAIVFDTGYDFGSGEALVGPYQSFDLRCIPNGWKPMPYFFGSCLEVPSISLKPSLLTP